MPDNTNTGTTNTGSNTKIVKEVNNRTSVPFVQSDLVQATVVRPNRIELIPVTQPLNPLEGWIYADAGDHHLYFYNGTTWKQCDN